MSGGTKYKTEEVFDRFFNDSDSDIGYLSPEYESEDVFWSQTVQEQIWHERRIQSDWIRQRRVKRAIKVTISTALTIAAFLLAWTPYAVVCLCEAFFGIDVNSISWLLVQLPCLMAKTACIWNPLVYTFHNTDFKIAFLEFFKSYNFMMRCSDHSITNSGAMELRAMENASTSTN